jgi:Zn-dependent protease
MPPAPRSSMPVTFSLGGPLLALGAADLRNAGIFLICLVISIAVHEFSHAWAATKLGDPTPEGEGRLTLNPIAHADPIGTLGLPIALSLMYPGLMFGWGRPVNTQARYFTRKVTMRGGMAIVAAAGPLSNLLLAALALVLAFVLANAGVIDASLEPTHPLRVFFSLNVLLFVFNLLPIHPLDGGKVLGWLLGARRQHIDDFMLRYGFMIIFALMLLGVLSVLFAPFMLFSDWLFYVVTR